jgi:GAF domain-containing protein
MIRQFLNAPHFESEDEIFRAKFINIFGLIVLGLLLVGIIPFLFQDKFNFTVVVLAALIGVMLLSLYLLRKRHLNQSGIILVVLTWAGITLQAYTADGVKDVIVVGYIAVSLLAGIINWRAGSVVLFVSIAAIWALTFLELNGLIAPDLEETLGYARDLSVIFVAIAALIYFSTTSLRDAVRRANQSERALRESNDTLHDLNQTLEERVATRTLELETAYQRNERRAKQFEAIAQVTRATAADQNLETLLPSLTRVISQQFGFYHTGIFLLDENREYAVLKAASSTGGNRMLQRQHKLRVGYAGIVGLVSATGAPRIALDVGRDAVFLDNPDLPQTRSELALPLRSADEVIGVLDVQSTDENAFQAEDIEVLSTLADQVTIAIQNAHAYEITQELLKQAERTSGTYLRDSWKILQSEGTRIGYIVSENTWKPLNTPLSSPQIEQVITYREAVVESGKNPVLAVPIHLRNDVVGVLDIHMPGEHEWDPDEIDIVQAVAERLSLAIETSLLIESTRRRAEMERVTSEISAKISSTAEFDSILRTAAEELSRVLGGSEVYVQLQPDALEARPQVDQVELPERSA